MKAKKIDTRFRRMVTIDPFSDPDAPDDPRDIISVVQYKDERGQFHRDITMKIDEIAIDSAYDMETYIQGLREARRIFNRWINETH